MNTAPPTSPRSTARKVAKVLLIILAVMAIAVGGCFVVMWTAH